MAVDMADTAVDMADTAVGTVTVDMAMADTVADTAAGTVDMGMADTVADTATAVAAATTEEH